ncbi:hypothetical protein L2E82_01876 [Cichorium intybus]|uniref:Uncharacterized protein n=1 Tax=Cichorium intybus TaxID=13427 RepID=A0ACB9H033_CICIN|nr:hypothetical protein L2E82_01876 [Cichorium intybus]
MRVNPVRFSLSLRLDRIAFYAEYHGNFSNGFRLLSISVTEGVDIRSSKRRWAGWPIQAVNVSFVIRHHEGNENSFEVASARVSVQITDGMVGSRFKDVGTGNHRRLYEMETGFTVDGSTGE